jgi:16S rRNA (adenine1518-N6/adenine1519-N6)-dimethyltransferase
MLRTIDHRMLFFSQMPRPRTSRAQPVNPRNADSVKPAYGQHFLTRREILERSLEYAKVNAEDDVLEVGPGPGTLTELLAQSARRVFSIEIDRKFEPGLSALQARYPNLSIIWGDALEVEFPRFNKIVANLPYRPSLPLIFKFLERGFHTAVLVIQSRLAKRLAAAAGDDGYSRISVVTQRIAALRVLETVKPECFSPPPDVDSAMIRLRKTRPLFPISSDGEFSLLLDFLFLRRKWTVYKALMDLPETAPVKAVLSQLPRSLTSKTIAMVQPAEFGKISVALAQFKISIPAVSNELKRKAQKYF